MKTTLEAKIENKPDLVGDERGAIMIMGLAMILGLIGFLWFLLGIGETLAFRDHMQEASDSAAFTQPAVEALCMNLIVLINIIMMVMVALYIIWSIVITGLWASSVLCCPTWAFLACCPRIPNYYSQWKNRNSGAKIMAQIDSVLSPLESIIAIAAPWAGTGLSYLSSSDYKMSSMTSKPLGFAVSPMNIPGTFDLGSTTKRFGLPVTHDYLGNDCSHLFDALVGTITGALGGDASKGIGKIAGKIGGALGAVVQWYYCDNALLPDFGAIAGDLTQAGGDQTGDDPSGAVDKDGNPVQQTITVGKFPPDDAGGGGGDSAGACNTSNGTSTGGGWERLVIGGGDGGNYWNCGKYGPMMNYKHPIAKPPAAGHGKEYKNGADEMQSYALLFISGAYSDHHATHNIGFMQLHTPGWASKAEVKPSTYGYYAQAELYFDCDSKWSSASCDDVVDGSAGYMDLTMYRFEWRSRLVKVHFPGGAGKILDFLNSVLGMVSSVRSFINGNGADEIVQALDFIDQGLGTNILGEIGSIADPIPGALAH